MEDFLGHGYLKHILAPIWKAYPDLMPPEMKEPYVEQAPTLCPESQAALSQFVSEARKAIEEVKRLVQSKNLPQILLTLMGWKRLRKH